MRMREGGAGRCVAAGGNAVGEGNGGVKWKDKRRVGNVLVLN
jgi:hypothetical protein